MHPGATFSKPPIRVLDADYERLTNLAESGDGEGAALLRRELDRARVLSARAAERAPPFVRLGSFVEYRDLLSGRLRKIQLTVPEAADIDAGRLSVLSPVGAALLGLAVGDTFSWSSEDGRPRLLCVQWVSGLAAAAEVREAG